MAEERVPKRSAAFACLESNGHANMSCVQREDGENERHPPRPASPVTLPEVAQEQESGRQQPDPIEEHGPGERRHHTQNSGPLGALSPLAFIQPQGQECKRDGLRPQVAAVGREDRSRWSHRAVQRRHQPSTGRQHLPDEGEDDDDPEQTENDPRQLHGQRSVTHQLEAQPGRQGHPGRMVRVVDPLLLRRRGRVLHLPGPRLPQSVALVVARNVAVMRTEVLPAQSERPVRPDGAQHPSEDQDPEQSEQDEGGGRRGLAQGSVARRPREAGLDTGAPRQ